MDNIYSVMTAQLTSQIRMLMDNARKVLLDNNQFNEMMSNIVYGLSQGMQIVNNPAILIKDIHDNSHFMVGGEKWKLFSAILLWDKVNETTNFTMKCTNPINNSYDVFETSREKVQNAIIEYERVYDENIELIMEINTMMNQIQAYTSNGDKLKAMEQVLDRFNAAIAAMNMYYGQKPGSEDLN